ncbi:MAG: putative toxin-antitoxin system toxin component, PIN family [Gemmataceae bacterium]
MRAVIDTGVLVSAALHPGSNPWRSFEAVRTAGVLLQSDDTIAELEEVLDRDKFDAAAPIEVRREFVAQVARVGQRVAVIVPVVACSDADDDKFLELAVNGRADYIVSSDKHLLALHPFRGIPILSPADFLAAVAASGS